MENGFENSNSNLNLNIMTVREVASYLQLSEATIYQMARNGRIPVVHMGRVWRFTRESIDAWINHSTGKAIVID